jgi:uncharacterized protein
VRLILDTNVLISGLLWRGSPHGLLDAANAGTIIIVSSPALLVELEEVLHRPKFAAILSRTSRTPQAVLDEVRKLVEVIAPPPLPQPVCRDPDDDPVLALAIAAQVDFIVSGDADLLDIGQYQGIGILSPATALAKVPG